MKQKKVKPGVAYTKSGLKKISGSASTQPSRQETAKAKKQVFNPKGSAVKSVRTVPSKKLNPLDAAISRGNQLPIKGKKKLPPDYDVIMPGMGYTKPTKKKPPRRNQGR